MGGSIDTHIVNVHIDAPARDVFDYVADGRNMADWSLGGFHTEHASPTYYSGRSLIDGELIHVEIEADQSQLTVQFRVGATRDQMHGNIRCEILPKAVLDLPANTCVLSLIAWRPQLMSADRWRQLCASHELEVLIIRNRFNKKTSAAGS